MPIISKKSFMLTFIFIILCYSEVSISYASEITIFGPKKFMRMEGNPNEYSGNFTGLFTDVITSGRLIILNGNLTGESRIEDAISSAEIYINGELIFGPSDFNKKVYRLEAAVILQEINSFCVKLKSTPGSYITVSLVQNIHPPSSSIYAAPEAIKADEDSLLVWNSILATDCSIEPGIGSVECNDSISVSPDETIEYTFTAAGPGGSVVSSTTITHLNSLPIAYDQSIVMKEDIGLPIVLSGSDPDNDSLQYTIVTYPVHGTVSGQPPDLLYMPDADYYGTDYFSFSVNDGFSDSEHGEVQINLLPENDAPTADAGNDQIVRKGDMVCLDGILSSDIDGDSLSFYWVISFAPLGSSASIINPGMNNPSFTPDVPGIYDIALIVNDGMIASIPDIVTITVNPEIIELPDVTGMSLSDADAILISAGFKTGAVTYVHDETIPEMHVVNQEPVPGAMLEAGSSIDLIISLGPYPSTGNGEISGKVINALTGSVIPNVEMTLYKEMAGGAPAVISHCISQEDGVYIFTNLSEGSYLVNADLIGFIAAECSAILETDESSINKDIILCPLMTSGEVRIVLTWGETPGDLESHLTAPNTEGCRYHCFYDTREIPGANLDLDDMTSYGPETITITGLRSGKYRYYVHDFSNRTSETSTALSLSGAHIRVYFGSGAAPLDFYVPAGEGTVWHVFDMDGDSQQITVFNTMSFQKEPGEIDFPVITSCPVTSANLGEAYTYQVEADDPDNDILIYSFEGSPDGMTIDPLTGEITWTPAENQGGYHDVIVKVSDNRCGEDTQTFQIYVTYMPIVTFSSDPSSAFNQDGEITLRWSTERAETVSIDQGMGIVSGSGSITISSPDEPVIYTLTAENGSGQKQATVPKKPSGSFTASKSVLPATGGMVTLTWSFPNAVTCSISQGIGEVASSGSIDVTVTETPITFLLTATNGAGRTTASLTINKECSDSVEIETDTDPVCSWSVGDPVTLSWETTSGCVDSCEIDQGIGEVPSSGSIQVTPDKTTRYTITCTGSSGTGSKSITLPQIKSLGITTFYANSNAISLGSSVRLTWTTQCVDRCMIDQGIGEVEANGSITVTPSSLPVTYTMTVEGNGETITKSITVNPRITATFEAIPSNLKIGESATLIWTSVNAEFCRITPDIGEVGLNGSVTVQPSENARYTLYISSSTGSVRKYATVTYIAPTAQLVADKEIIKKGESVTLSWVFSNAKTCTINQGIGGVGDGESITVTPDQTTTYTMSAVGPGGTATDSVTINVVYPPEISVIQPDGIFDNANKYYTIIWKDEDKDSDAIISLYYDTDNSGNNGVLIASDIHEDTESTSGQYDRYIWDISEMDEGEYYIYVVIDDDCHDPVVDYSEGPVAIDHSLSAFKITASDGAEYDYFGGSVAMDQGYLIVGAYGDDDGEYYDSGAAYIYKQDGESWTEQVKLTADDAQTSENFGCSVSISGDYSAVGASYADTSTANYAGAVYVFKKEGESWIQQVKITADDGSNEQNFGAAVFIRDDLLIVGAPGDSKYDQSSGAAYVYKQNGSDWVLQGKIYPSNPRYLGYFGTSVGIKGDDTVIVGSCRYYVYIFEYKGSEWVEQSILSSGDASSYFGSSVSIDGDYIVVGDQGYDSVLYSLSNSGAAFLFGLSDSIWVETDMFEPEDVDASDRFGYSAFIKGNYIIAGATGDDDGDSNAGAAYIYNAESDENGTITSWAVKSKLLALDPEANDSFGSSVYLNDGYAIIGSIGDDDKGSSSGSAYIYPIYLAVNVNADPDIIEKGGSTTILWTSVLADTIEIEPELGTLGANGSVVISPDETTTYVITASGSDGSMSKDVTVTVVDPTILPSVEISADPESIGYGDSTVLSWNSVNAMYCSMEPDIGFVSRAGSIIVSPSQDTTYTITAYNSGGSAIATVAVTVICYNPIVTATIEPDIIELGDSATITWNGKYTDSCNISPDVGEVGAIGSVNVIPEDSMTYVLIATGVCGTTTYNIPITVNGVSSIEIIYPNGVNEYADQTCKIKWTDKGPNVDAVISLYYDTDNTGEDGTLIISGINETPDRESGDSYTWDTSGMPEGVYYIYAVIEDGINTPVIDYSDEPVSIVHTVPEALKLSGNNPLEWESFGYSVALSGDYAIIGDTKDSVYIFKQDGAVWTLQERLIIKDSSGAVNSEKAVSIDGDFAVVGVYNAYNSAGLKTGMAYIFQRQGDIWVELAQLEPDDGEYGDNFGCSVSISGDSAIIGAKTGGDSSYPYDDGSVYVFNRDGTSWIKQAKLVANDGGSYDYFGYSVSLSGDYAIIGAREDDNGNLSTSGSAYIFKREGDAWSQETKLTPSDLTSYECFGTALAIEGDYAVVGSPLNDNSGYTNSGAVYIFKKDGGIWNQQIKLVDAAPTTSGRFGQSVSINNYRIIVGGNLKAYVFQYDGAAWNQQKKMTSETSSDVFGSPVAISEDYALVSDYGDDDAGDASGAVYFYPLAFVDIDADPETILSGKSTKLTWSSSFVDSCTIEPDIGEVDAAGSITVSPAETTIYTVTATGYGITATDKVTVSVTYTAPAVSINAEPSSIAVNSSSLLSWNTTNATSCEIDNGIGNVDVNGSITITPSATTDYTITATGPGGTATASVTVTVTYPVPTLTLTAEPQIITTGSSTVLTWSSQYATSCIIEPGIGFVDIEGTLTLSPATTTTYTISATGPGGTTSNEITITVNPSYVTINSPENGATVYSPDIIVEGSIIDQTGEIGVNVNGVVALVEEDYFAANHVPLEDGVNTITITVTNADGTVNTSTINVYYQPADTYIRVSVDDESGVAPFETALKIEGTFTFDSEPIISSTGPGDIVITDSENDNEYQLAITTPGLYFLTAEVEYEGVAYSDTVALLVINQEVLDALLKSKWNGMKSALSDSDIEKALSYHHEIERADYETVYNLLGSNIQSKIQEMQDIELVFAEGNRAKYRIKRVNDFNGQLVTMTYYIYFSKDNNGLWMIERY